jgi:hypothetical protein
MKRSFAGLVSGLSAFAALCAISASAGVVQVPQTSHLYKAYRMLARAHYVLRVGTRSGEARRQAAMQQVAAAVEQLRLLAAANHENLPPLSESGTPAAATAEIHHHAWMHDALRQCQDAKGELQGAQNDSGGHRTKAIQHVNAATTLLQQIVNQQ